MGKEKRKVRRILGICAATSVLGATLIGSWQYYSGYAQGVTQERLLSAVIYSAIQLFLFNPTVSNGAATPLLYEIAKWVAPLCTAFWVVRALESVFRHSVGVLRQKYGRRNATVVFGYNEKSAIFIKNMAERKERQVILVTEEPLDREMRLSLEKQGTLVWQTELPEDGKLCEERLKKLRLDRVSEILLFYEDAAWNFTLLERLIACAARICGAKDGGGNIYCAVYCEDPVMEKLITDYYDGLTGGKPFNLSFFCLPDMAAELMFRERPLYGNCLDFAEGVEGTDELFQRIPNPHLLIAGFGRYGQAVFEKALLSGRLSVHSRVPGYERLQITIIDKNGDYCRGIIEARYPKIDSFCQVNYIDYDIGGSQVEKRLAELPEITYAVICFSDQTTDVRVMEKLQTYLVASRSGRKGEGMDTLRIPVAVRMKRDGAVIRYRREHGNGEIFSFGTSSELLTFEHVIRYEMEEIAKEFHYQYTLVQSQIYGEDAPREGKDALWIGLNYEKKESCRAQVLVRPYFRELIRRFCSLPEAEKVLPLGRETDGFLAFLEKNRALELLAELEHARWCAFCYASGYVGYHPDPKEKGKVHLLNGRERLYGKVHNCLIDSWDEIKADPAARKTIVYDVCGIYGYAETKKCRDF